MVFMNGFAKNNRLLWDIWTSRNWHRTTTKMWDRPMPYGEGKGHKFKTRTLFNIFGYNQTEIDKTLDSWMHKTRNSKINMGVRTTVTKLSCFEILRGRMINYSQGFIWRSETCHPLQVNRTIRLFEFTCCQQREELWVLRGFVGPFRARGRDRKIPWNPATSPRRPCTRRARHWCRERSSARSKLCGSYRVPDHSCRLKTPAVSSVFPKRPLGPGMAIEAVAQAEAVAAGPHGRVQHLLALLEAVHAAVIKRQLRINIFSVYWQWCIDTIIL